MTIESNISKVSFVGNGVSNTLSVTYPYINKTDVKVYKEVGGSSVLMELNTDYTLQDLKNANGEITGGTITFTVTPEDGLKIIAIREVPYTQEVDYRENDIFPAETLEDALDKVTMLVQQVKETADRSVSVGIFSDSDPSEIVGEIEALYDIKDSVVTAANISSDIVTCSNNIDAIKDAENNANDARNSKIEAQNSAVTAQLMAAQAQEWATKTDGKVDGTNYSSKYYAGQASNSAQSAQEALDTVNGLIATPIGTIFMSIYVDESLDIARRLNGQVISSTKFTGFRAWLNDVQTAFPSLFTTETNWQAEKTNSKLGQCGKFVIDDTAGTIRLPCVVNAQSLTDLQYLGTIKNESLPNITGSLKASSGFPLTTTLGPDAANGCIAVQGKSTTNVHTVSSNTNNRITSFDIDASRSSSTYQDNAPVQQEAVQYPYYIQVATGIEETLPAIREYHINTPFFFGQSMYSDVAPDNASWLASNGQYNARSVYPDYYDWLVEQMNAGVSGFVASTAAYTDYDFVINTTDQTFRLPLLDGSEDLPDYEHQIDNVITGTINSTGQTYTAPKSGLFYQQVNIASDNAVSLTVNNTGQYNCYNNTSNYATGSSVKVRKGDIIKLFVGYGSGTGTIENCHFTPFKGNGTLYYYVGDTVQDASLINAGAVLGQLSNKADIDASNFNAAGKSLLSGLGMPSGRYIDLTLGASGSTYTAPANGWVYVRKGASAVGQFITCQQEEAQSVGWSLQSDNYAYVFHPVRKGNFSISYSSAMGSTSSTCRFIYAEGEN